MRGKIVIGVPLRGGAIPHIHFMLKPHPDPGLTRASQWETTNASATTGTSNRESSPIITQWSGGTLFEDTPIGSTRSASSAMARPWRAVLTTGQSDSGTQ